MPETTGVSSDAQVSTAVQAKYYTDQAVRGSAIDVTANDGVVTLRGTVDDEADRERAVALARETEGVTQVDDQLRVEAEPPASADRRENTGSGELERIAEETEPVAITTNIQARYFLAPNIKPSRIDVSTSRDGVVTLDGTVESEEARADAIRIARDIDGVHRVEDRLRVQSGDRTDERAAPAAQTAENDAAGFDSPDAWLTMKVQAKYFMDPDVRGRNIDVTTRDGVVTLTGAVGSEAERRQAVTLAENTDGVMRVTDRLTVDSAMDREDASEEPAIAEIERPDPWITTKIQAKYFLDADVKGHEIDVDTSDGVVTLSGTVESPEQKLEAEQIARETEGVSRVINDLRIESSSGAQ
jgi:osmotically-inducible protein OsmY